MSLADQLNNATNAKYGPTCRFCYMRDGLDVKDREALDLAMATLTLSAPTLAAVLQAEGHEIAAESIRRHRRKQCST